MNPYSVHLIAATACEMRELRESAIASAIRAGTTGCSPRPGQPAAITISLECWRDENGKLHCKLSVSFGASAA